MPKADALKLSILDRMIERRKEQLAIARMTRNKRLEERIRREVRAMEADRRQLCREEGTPRSARKRAGSARSVAAPRRPTAGGAPRVTRSALRPTLRDENTAIASHSRRWQALIKYIRHLNDSFPGEDLMSVVGLFSTERQFARHIRSIESRLPARRRRGASTSRARPARKAGRRKKTASKKTASRKTRKASRSASGRRKASPGRSASRAKR